MTKELGRKGLGGMRRIIVREANLYEFDDVRAFYKANPDEHVMLRAEEVVKAAFQTASFLSHSIQIRRSRPEFLQQVPCTVLA